MDIETALLHAPMSVRDLTLVERFNNKWLFEIPPDGIVIFKNLLFFNDIFLNTFDLLARLLPNIEIFVCDQRNTENYQQIFTMEDLKKFKETNQYNECRYIVGNDAISIYVQFRLFWSYKKTLNMEMTDEK